MRSANTIRSLVFVGAMALTGCAGLELNRPFRAQPGDWTQAGGDADRRSFVASAPALPWARLWEYNAQAGILATPLVRDSIVILGTLNGEVQAVDLRTGKRLGYQKVGGPVRGTPAMNGTVVYVPVSATNRPSILALDVKQGIRVWEMTIGPVESSLMLNQGWLFASTLEGRVYCLSAATGEERWRTQLGTKSDRKPIRSAPALSGDVLVVGSDAGTVTGLDASTGSQRWSLPMSGSVFAGVATSEGMAVVGDLLGRVVGIDTERGSVRWTRELESPVYAAAAVGDGTCYVPTANGRLHALDLRTGATRWQYQARSVINASPLIAGDRLIVGSLDRSVAVIEARDGSLLERLEVSGRVKVAPVVWRDFVVVAFEDKSVVAYSSRMGGR